MVAMKEKVKKIEQEIEQLTERQRCLRGWDRVYFVGAHSTGKTTLAEWVSQEYSLTLVTEVARNLLKQMKTTLDEIRKDPKKSDGFQLAVFGGQLLAEEGFVSFVSDRACDHLAYASETSGVTAQIFRNMNFWKYMMNLRSAKVFFVRPHLSLLRHDGVRTGVDWENVQRIDAVIKFILKAFDVPFVEITSPEMDSRVSTVRAVLGTATPVNS